MKLTQQIQNKIYAGLLGKAIGVYLGRPVEGWPYEEIKERFGQLDFFVNKDLSIPLIVADDDLSGTSTFFRAMEDNNFSKNLKSSDIGDSWLNYIIEDRTILWWGGLGNSTEHTAYLRLKNGIKAPESGSLKLNGEVMATQVGSQIFMEEYALMCPGDPEMAISFVDKAVSVSHDGIAREGACFLAALESLAFVERSNEKIFQECKRFVKSRELKEIIDYVEDVCIEGSDWRAIRNKVGQRYGYDRYLGPAPFETNHAMVLAGILAGGDDFARSVMIGASAGWDTDCNAGNIGCYNGIRLGLEGMKVGTDFATPVADRLIIVSSEGGECFTDVVRETRKVVDAICVMHGDSLTKKPRFFFEYPGSLQGFQSCPYVSDNHSETSEVFNEKGEGLSIKFKTLAKGTPYSLSTPTFFDIKEKFNAYEMYGSPILYETQTVFINIEKDDNQELSVRMYIWTINEDNDLIQIYSSVSELQKGNNSLSWRIPELKGKPVLRFGFCFSSLERCTSSVTIKSIDWSNTPQKIKQKGIMMKDMWDLNPFWAKMFVPSAKIFAPNLKHTYCISHNEENGVSTLGTRDFTDYSITSNLSFSLHESGGIVVRARGHRRYYAAIFQGGNEVRLVKRIDDQVSVLTQTNFSYEQFVRLHTVFSVVGNTLNLVVNGVQLLETKCAEDKRLSSGAGGFIINRGSMFIDDFILEGINQ